jgi:hypothetical protein
MGTWTNTAKPYARTIHEKRLIGFQRGAPIRKTIPPKISDAAPNVRTPEEQLTSSGTFIDFAHQLGAPQVHATDATISDGGQKVELFFSHRDFPDARFGYHAKTPGDDVHEKLWLAEELATGALHRIMRDTTPAADAAGITWLRLDEQLLRADS